jgi:hypothetical protein
MLMIEGFLPIGSEFIDGSLSVLIVDPLQNKSGATVTASTPAANNVDT